MFKVLCVSMLLTGVAHAQAAQTASDVCVFNEAAFVLTWHLKDLDSNTISAETTHYPVGQVHCMSAASLASISNGHAIVPVVHAILGKHVTPSETVIYDGINVSQVTYVCRGTTLDFSCKPGTPPLPAKNVTEDIGKFIIGFREGLGKDIGFADCLQDIKSTYQKIKAIVDFFESGVNHKTPANIAKAFSLIGDMLKEFSTAITVCAKDAVAFAAKLKDLASALGGNVWSIIKTIVKDGVMNIYHERHDLTHDCKATVADWHAGDFVGAGKAVGDIVRIILGGIIREQPELMVV